MNRLLRKLLLGFSCLALFTATTAKATTWTVSTPADSDTGSTTPPSGTLRWCINHAASGDTIVFTNTVSWTVTLSTFLSTISQNITITGSVNPCGQNLVTVSGNNAIRVFSITAGMAAINNLIINNGSSPNGGAIANSGALTLTGCTFSNNVSTGGADYGGGAISNTGPLTVTGCIFIDNTAGNSGAQTGVGGAIFNSSGLTVNGCTFTNNIAGNSGGAIFNNFAGTVTVGSSTFTGNESEYGGAIETYNALTVTMCTFSGNSAYEFQTGGALDCRTNCYCLEVCDCAGGPITVDACTFNGNTALSGGAIFSQVPTTVTSSTFAGNSCGFGYGGAICMSDKSTADNPVTLTLTSCTISSNEAYYVNTGGGVALASGSGPNIVRNCIISGNSSGPLGTIASDVLGNVTSQGFNIIGSVTDSSGWIAPGSAGADTLGLNILQVNVGLGPLANNGGSTETMALQKGYSFTICGTGCTTVVESSPAIDRGYSFGYHTDQRGYERPVNFLHGVLPSGGDATDIGAYEVQNPTLYWGPPRGIGICFDPPVPPPAPPNVYELDFLSVAGATNFLQSTGDLVSGMWSNVAGSVGFVGNGGIVTIDITNNSNVAQQFYRVATDVQGEAYVPPSVAYDSTIDPAYSNAWTSSSNGGQGFGPWTLTETSTNINSDGFFLGSSTNNGNGTNNIDVGGDSWGIYANGGNLTVAYRPFTNSLAASDLLGVEMDNGYVNATGSVGFVLRHGNVMSSPTNYTTGARMQFLYVGFDPTNSYKVVDANGEHNLGVPFTGTGLQLVFTLTTTDTYTLLTIDNATGATNSMFSGTLAGSGTVDSIALFNNNAGAGSGNNIYFNSLQTIAAGP
jgi:predicted outer membrane repeat protein